MDNLGSGTYETFERDPVKYERYEEVRYLVAPYSNDLMDVNRLSIWRYVTEGELRERKYYE